MLMGIRICLWRLVVHDEHEQVETIALKQRNQYTRQIEVEMEQCASRVSI